MEVLSIFQNLQQNASLAVQVLAIVITLATVITSLTPSRSDDQRLDRLLKLLNLLAGNVGFNRNADDR